ncbi:MAG: metallophosphoesterase, partial [Oscillospiraceae bacterium]|nr:metallophosphoesterase [Oscillospiraceae bacterium]
HTHGGQVRIPFILNGLVAPDQGLFPRFAGGLYAYNDLTLVVSRGLATDHPRIPRIFNPPEIVVIILSPS